MKTLALGGVALAGLAATLFACSDETTPAPAPDGGVTASAGEVQVTITGETAAVSGFGFPPASDDEPAFVDGWQVTFERVLVTVSNVTLSETPDKNPTDQSETDEVVARLEGTWAVDLHAGGPIVGKGGGGERAVALGVLKNQNAKGGAAFDTSRRYAFGYDVVAASAAAQKVNLSAAALADYDVMIQKGWAVLYVGEADWKGGAACSAGGDYDFAKLPTKVRFRFGFATPTTYRNCQNPDLQGEPLSGEEAQRGIPIKANEPNVAQITMHLDHPFWTSVDHEVATATFDQLAMLATPGDAGSATLELSALEGVDFTAFKDRAGATLPWRSCLASKPPRSGARAFDPGSVAVDPSKPPSEALRHYADFATYVQSSQGHLNADGLCAVKRNYPSPR